MLLHKFCLEIHKHVSAIHVQDKGMLKLTLFDSFVSSH